MHISPELIDLKQIKPTFGCLKDKVVVVTGSTQGLGAAIARQVACSGAAGVVICGRQQDCGKAVADDIQNEFNVKTCFQRTDLRQVEDCQNLVATSCKTFGRIDALVNAAGLSTRGSIENTSPELFDELISVNLRAPFFTIQAAVLAMQKQNSAGSIVNIISISSYGGQSYLAPYVAAKAGLIALTRNVAYSQRWRQIRCNALNIGWTETPNEHKVQLAMGKSENWLEQVQQSLPAKSLLQPHQIAKATTFLLSNDSAPITGSIIDWDQQPVGCWD
ncbi:MAG: SDR family oxidoreductase [Moorea sp. SIO3I7]|uniref:Ketoreductase domain-containing protein n=1 Tax=Moorena bouillonii PNG TaxID=568701 RepID=A0A1U7N0D7_9CYAN|nr:MULTISPECIES: SDR family oxidoreductase [Moorena]NEN94082.1 SDR family oxidoreductase [Moorena sp. SIO3I7]NEO12364.1 SDR family oxidoreductase [Moorena sp. SIO3E8]NEQ78729.1 SDR family oxidoreductase [Moorena sp. SIO2I5]OLT59410.1 hypothetical protein BJP37_10480 [Moorena bouillonii PNG]